MQKIWTRNLLTLSNLVESIIEFIFIYSMWHLLAMKKVEFDIITIFFFNTLRFTRYNPFQSSYILLYTSHVMFMFNMKNKRYCLTRYYMTTGESIICVSIILLCYGNLIYRRFFGQGLLITSK